MIPNSLTVFDDDFHVTLKKVSAAATFRLPNTREHQGTRCLEARVMSSNLQMCTDLFSNKLDTLVREHVGFAHDLWSLMNWSNPS